MIRLAAHAKVNLFLRVTEMRDDGFHGIETIFQSISLADEVVLEPRPDGGVTVEMSLGPGIQAELPDPEANLARRAAASLRERVGSADGVHISITKNIPVGAGLAGGSVDAAAVLLGLEKLWQLDLAPGELDDLALCLGSDVPYCLVGGTRFATGRGEKIHECAQLTDGAFVLGVSYEPLSTGAVYRAWDELDYVPPPHGILAAVGDVFRRETFEGRHAADLVHNDLERASLALRPDLGDKKARMAMAPGVQAVAISGSGPTIFALHHSRDDAAVAAAAVLPVFDRVLMAQPVPASVVVLDD